jgi:hypothetical protein
MKKALIASCFAAALFAPATALAQPAGQERSSYTPGNYLVIQEVHIEPGQFENYMDYLADQYRRSQEFARQQGWISAYQILSNVNKREGEADLMLITVMPRMATPQEQVQREEAMNRHLAQTTRAAEQQSGQRVSMRRLGGSMLLQELRLNPASRR